MYSFESFTEDAKRTLSLAQEEAERAHHSYIGTEHLLLGLLRLPSGTAHAALRELGIDIAAVRRMITAILGRNERMIIRQVHPTSRVKKVIEIAFDQARRMGTTFVDSGHLLIALTIEGEGIAAYVLEDLGASQKQVVAAVERAMGTAPTGKVERPRPARPNFPPVPSVAMTRDLPRESDAEALLRLLQLPHVANLLRAKGLVEVEGLAAKLAEPPSNVVRLRLQSRDLIKQLEQAEQDWLRDLTE